jgi:hypothetical protein
MADGPLPPRNVKATLAGAAVFIVILVGGMPLTYNAVSHLLFTRTDFPGGAPPERFNVAYREMTQSGPGERVRLASWKDIAAAKDKGSRFTFLLPAPGGIIPTSSDLHAYSILEDRGASQLIETRYRNTHAVWTRYEAWPERIVPISQRTDGGFLMIVPLGVLFFAAWITADKVQWALRRRLAARTAPP